MRGTVHIQNRLLGTLNQRFGLNVRRNGTDVNSRGYVGLLNVRRALLLQVRIPVYRFLPFGCENKEIAGTDSVR
jgi:hypothetical protein